MFLLRRGKQAFKTIDESTEREILALHEEYPELGRKRPHQALLERGIEVDALQLKRFLRVHDIGTPPPIGQARPVYSRVPWIPWPGRQR